jgi:hypothetical protein
MSLTRASRLGFEALTSSRRNSRTTLYTVTFTPMPRAREMIAMAASAGDLRSPRIAARKSINKDVTERMTMQATLLCITVHRWAELHCTPDGRHTSKFM